MSETDGNFNKIDSELRQIEEHIHQIEEQLDKAVAFVEGDNSPLAQLEAKNKRMSEYIEEYHDEDFVMWCREQDALKEGE